MNAIQATLDLLPSSPTLQAFGTRALSGWSSITEAVTSSKAAPSEETEESTPRANTASARTTSIDRERLENRARSQSFTLPADAVSDKPMLGSPFRGSTTSAQASRPSSSDGSSTGQLSSSCDSLLHKTHRVVATQTKTTTSNVAPREPLPDCGKKRMSGRGRSHSYVIVPVGSVYHPETVQRPSSRSTILASASQAMNGSPRLNKLTPVHENDDIMDGFMLPPPRTRTFASKSAYSTVAAKKSQSGASERPSRHSRSQSAFAMPTIGNALQTVCPSSPKTSKGISTTAISTVLATFVDNIDIRATEMQPAPQFRNPFLQSSPSLTSSSSHCTFGDNFGRPSLTSTSPAFPTSATMPDLASVLATESHALDITTRHRTVSSCSTNVKSRATALGMPVSNSGTIELQPHAMFFPRSAPHWPHSPPPSSHRARDPSSSFSSTRIPLYAQLPGRSSAGHSRQQSQSDRTRIDPIFNTGGQNGTLGRTAAQYSSSAGPRRANSLPKGYLPQYKEFREPVRASHVANVRSARSRHIEEPGHQAASHVPGRHLFTHAHLNNSTSSLHSASQASPTLGSLRIPRGSSTKRNELLRPIDTALANKGRKANSSRRAASIADESGSPTDIYLDVPPLSSGTTSSASSISSASLDARAMSRVESGLPIPDTTYGKHGSGDATITERDRWHSLAYVRGREYFPVGPDTAFDSNPGIESASSGARSSSPDKFPRSDSFRSTTDTHRRQSSISSSLSFLIWPSRPSTSSIVHNDSMLRHADGSDAGVERSYRQTQSGLGMSYEHQSEYGQQEEDEEEAALDELAGWNSYVSMTDVHSPVLDRSPVFSSARPALTRGKGSVRVL